jgi:uncharacterized protein YjbI with pentapeptide repeats
MNYYEETSFEKVDFSGNKFETATYENSEFKQCDFSNANFSGAKFIDCRFIDCNLGLVKTDSTSMNNIRFLGCKLIGIQWDRCNPIGFAIMADACVFDHSTFYKMRLKGTTFKNCRFQEADFTEADLSLSVFAGCDLSRTVFHHTNLEKSDFRLAFNYQINPMENKIRKAKFSHPDVLNLLTVFDIVIG